MKQMTKHFEVGSYAINNKGIGIAGPQSTIYKVVSIVDAEERKSVLDMDI